MEIQGGSGIPEESHLTSTRLLARSQCQQERDLLQGEADQRGEACDSSGRQAHRRETTRSQEKEMKKVTKLTDKQKLGLYGVRRVVSSCTCPRCKRAGTLKPLPPNFKCADIICDFCGYSAQVKTHRNTTSDIIPRKILGAAWGPQKERMDAGSISHFS